KIDISDRAQLIVIARRTVVDDFEFELRPALAGLVALAPCFEVSGKFVVRHNVNCFQVTNTSEVVHHPFDDRFASNWQQWFRFIESQWIRSEEHTSELQSRGHLVCRLL